MRANSLPIATLYTSLYYRLPVSVDIEDLQRMDPRTALHGLLSDAERRRATIEVLPDTTPDANAFISLLHRVRKRFRIDRVIFRRSEYDRVATY